MKFRLDRFWLTASLAVGLTALFATGALAQTRVVAWNVLRGETASSNYRTVLDSISGYEVNGVAVAPDVVTLQETTSSTSAFFASSLEAITGDEYAWGNAGSFLPVGIVYNTSKYDLVGSGVVSGDPRPALRYDLRPKGYTSADAIFSVYSFHLKAGGDSSTTSSDAIRRANTATGYKKNAESLRPFSPSLNVLYTGDFNVRRSDEGGFANFTTAGRAQADDPIQQYGIYKNNPAFRGIHTHSTSDIDDRFDLQLASLDALDGEGFSYLGPRGDVPAGLVHSYQSYGNTNLYNQPITSSSDPQVSAAARSALRSASDHLPVVADYQLPAWMRVTEQTAGEPLLVLKGDDATLDFTVENAAPVVSRFGADELDYAFAATGDVSGGVAGAGQVFATQPESVSVSLDTSTAGAKTATVEFVSDSQAVQDGFTGFTREFGVAERAQGSFDADQSGVDTLQLDVGIAALGTGPSSFSVDLYNVAIASLQATLGVQEVLAFGSDALSLSAANTGVIGAGGVGELGLALDTTELGLKTAQFRVVLDETAGLGASNDPGVNLFVTARVGGSVADFDLDGQTDAADIDRLGANLGGSGGAADGDLDGDGDIDNADLAWMIEQVLGTAFGDLDLDGDVDGIDFNAFAVGFGSTGAGYADGDLDLDGDVDGLDFNTFAVHFGFDNNASILGLLEADDTNGAIAAFNTAVPEPTSLLLLTLGGLAVSRRRRGVARLVP